MLRKRIEKEFREAMKSKDEAKVSAMRMLKSELQKLVIEKREELKEENVIKVIQKLVRQHKDSIEQFTKGQRGDLVEREKKQLAALETFLPNMLSEEESQKLVKDVITELGASTRKDMGRVMKEVLARAKGRADGKTINRLVCSQLK